jgi:hypothetical protein
LVVVGEARIINSGENRSVTAAAVATTTTQLSTTPVSNNSSSIDNRTTASGSSDAGDAAAKQLAAWRQRLAVGRQNVREKFKPKHRHQGGRRGATKDGIVDLPQDGDAATQPPSPTPAGRKRIPTLHREATAMDIALFEAGYADLPFSFFA